MRRLANLNDGDAYDVYIGRGSKWGNPFRMVNYSMKERLRVIELYNDYIRNNEELLACLPELKNKVLGCFCYPKPCHGDILLNLLQERGIE